MNRIISVLVVCFFFTPEVNGHSSRLLSDYSEIRQIAITVLVYAGGQNERVDIPYRDVPGVSHSVENLTEGTLVFASHEEFIFSPEEPVAIVFYKRSDWIIAGFSNGTAQLYRESDPPQWGMAYTLGAALKDAYIRVFPILNLLLLGGILAVWIVRRRRQNEGGNRVR